MMSSSIESDSSFSLIYLAIFTLILISVWIIGLVFVKEDFHNQTTNRPTAIEKNNQYNWLSGEYKTMTCHFCIIFFWILKILNKCFFLTQTQLDSQYAYRVNSCISRCAIKTWWGSVPMSPCTQTPLILELVLIYYIEISHHILQLTVLNYALATIS